MSNRHHIPDLWMRPRESMEHQRSRAPQSYLEGGQRKLLLRLKSHFHGKENIEREVSTQRHHAECL